ncbi:MAG: AMP-binding protein [Flavobacteriales bacterium]
MASSPYIHPKFKFNGISYTNAEELLNFVDELILQGDDYEVAIGNFLEQWLNFEPTIKVKTSGSTGNPKEILLLKTQMIASAKATGNYFQLPESTKALLCLSANYIAGKMMLVRALVLGWDLHVVAPVKDALTQYDNSYDFVAMVPYQVHYSIAALHKVKKIIVGGGAISAELYNQLQQIPTKVFATYGMTETSTHIAVKRINGNQKSEFYEALPNVTFSIDSRNCLVIEAPYLFQNKIITNDVVQLVSSQIFKFLGRIDHVINSGGVKIIPEEVEKKIATFLKLPFIIAALNDDVLGEKVILIIENKDKVNIPNLSNAFLQLTKYQIPKKIYTFSEFPYTETGKIKRKQVLQILKNRLRKK